MVRDNDTQPPGPGLLRHSPDEEIKDLLNPESAHPQHDDKGCRSSRSRSRSRKRTTHEDTNDATNDHQRRLERLAAEFVPAKDSVESAVQYLKPRIQQILHRIRMAEIAINNLSEVADDITNLPTILKCLNVGQQRVAALEAKYEDALRAPPNASSSSKFRTVVTRTTTTTTMLEPAYSSEGSDHD